LRREETSKTVILRREETSKTVILRREETSKTGILRREETRKTVILRRELRQIIQYDNGPKSKLRYLLFPLTITIFEYFRDVYS
jgi:hypothetical protein